MEPAKVLLVLKHGEVEHRLKIFRGTPQAELLSSIREVLAVPPGLPIQFLDEDNDQVVLSSWAPSGTALKVISAGGCNSCEMLPQPPMVEHTIQNAQGADVAGLEDNLDETAARAEAQKLKLVIERLRAADLAMTGEAAERLVCARNALQERPGLDEMVQIYKSVNRVAHDRVTSSDLRSMAAAMRDLLVLRCIRDAGLIDSSFFIRKMSELFGGEHTQDWNLWSSLKLAHQKIMVDLFARPDLWKRTRPKKKGARARRQEPEPECSAGEVNQNNVPTEMTRQGNTARLHMPQPCDPHRQVRVVNTFVDVDDDPQSCGEVESNPSAWTSPEAQQFTPTIRKRVDGLLKQIANRALSPEVCGNRAQSLSTLLTTARYIPLLHQEMFRKQPLVYAAFCHAADPVCLEKILDVLSKICGPDFVLEMEPLLCKLEDPKAIVQCCNALGKSAQADDAATTIVQKLLATMSRFVANTDVQEACLHALLKVMRAFQEVLGLRGARHACSKRLPSEILLEVSRVAHEASGYGEGCRNLAIRVLARTKPIALVVDAALGGAQPFEFLAAALEEVIYTLEQPLAALGCNDEAEAAWACSFLREVSEQRQPLSEGIDITNWLFSSCSDFAQINVQMRFTLAGLLFGIEQGVVTPMTNALTDLPDAQQIHSPYHILHAACRALIHLNDVVPFGPTTSRHVAQKAHTCMNALMRRGCSIKQRVRSSYAGLLGTVMRGSACDASGDESGCALVADVVQHVLQVAQWGMREWWLEEGFFHEALWALAEIFNGAPSLGKQQNDIQALARQLHMNFKPWIDTDRCGEDHVKVVEIAALLAGWPVKE